HARAVLRGGSVVRGVPAGLRRTSGGPSPRLDRGSRVIGVVIAAGRTIHQPPPPGLAGSIPEFVIAGLLALLGLRSLRKWMGRQFPATSTSEQVLYALNVTARVGMWFALAGFFVAYALVDDPQGLGWYL